eukprot:scaffold27051_cov113-Skeletonema_menzelii.AAC.6
MRSEKLYNQERCITPLCQCRCQCHDIISECEEFIKETKVAVEKLVLQHQNELLAKDLAAAKQSELAARKFNEFLKDHLKRELE